MSEIEKLEALQKIAAELANELEAELKQRYEGSLGYPSQKHRFDRDMCTVTEARALLRSLQEKEDV